jgi:hypothetical protein
MRVWPSEETASSLFNWANLLLLGALAVGVISTGLVVWMGNVKEEYLKRDIAASNARALEAQLALEKFKAGRTLKEEQQKRISASLRPFAGTVFNIAASNAREPLSLVVQIEAALAAADWKQIDWPADVIIRRGGKSSLGIANETGIAVQVEIAERDKMLDIAKALASALMAEGIAAEAQLMPADVPYTRSQQTIHLVVGEKPQ